MDVKFHWVKYQNIMSVGAKPIHFVLDEHKKTLVTGSNGAGKSTFIEALTFMLYGKAFRDVPKPLLVNSDNKKNLVVEGELSVGNDRYHIKRGMKPNVLKITKNGEPLKEVASATEYQAYFEDELLGISYDSFKQIIVLGTAGYKPFMELPAGKRRELVEDLLDVSVIGDMDKINKGIIKEKKGELDLKKVQLTSVESEIQTAESAIEAQQKQTNMMIVMLTTNFREVVDQAKAFKESAARGQIELDSLVEPVYVEQDDSNEITEKRDRLESDLAELASDHEEKLADINCRIGEHKLMIPYECALDHDIMMLEQSKPTDDDLRVKTAGVPIPDEPVYVEAIEPAVVNVREELRLANGLMNAIELDKRQQQSILKFLESGGSCPTCGTDCSSHSTERVDEITAKIREFDAKIAEQKQIIDELNSEELKYESDVKAYRAVLDQNDRVRRDYERETAQYAQACRKLSEDHQAEIRRIEREIEEMRLNHSQQVIDYERHLRILEDERSYLLTSYRDAKSEIESKISDLADEADRLETKRRSQHEIALTRYRSNVESLTSSIATNTKSYETTADNARNLKKQIDELKEKEYDRSQVEEVSKRASALKDDIAKLVLELHHRSVVGDMLKDNGVKAHIIKRYIPVFNKKINEYLKALGADYVFALDEGFNESIKSRGREEFCYASFSEGEKARINLSLLFTWRDVSSMISGVNINLLCMDEVFDGSCDESGIVGINKMLNDMKSNILVISHRKDAMDDSFDRHIRMKKQGRFTTMG